MLRTAISGYLIGLLHGVVQQTSTVDADNGISSGATATSGEDLVNSLPRHASQAGVFMTTSDVVSMDTNDVASVGDARSRRQHGKFGNKLLRGYSIIGSGSGFTMNPNPK